MNVIFIVFIFKLLIFGYEMPLVNQKISASRQQW